MNILVLLLSCWAMAQSPTTFSETPSKLIEAINQESITTIKKLAQNQKELKKKDSAGYDPLHHAVSLNNPEIVQILLNAGASTSELYGDEKESILFEATRLGSPQVVTMLLKKDPGLLKTKNQKQETPLFEAVRSNQSSVAKIYLTKGLSLKERNKDGKTPQSYLDPTNEKMVKLLKQYNKS